MERSRLISLVPAIIVVFAVAGFSNSGSARRVPAGEDRHGEPSFTSATYNVGAVDSTDVVALGDFNGDGFPDIAVGAQVGRAGTVTISLNQGDGTFGPFVAYPDAGTPESLAVADFDGDGALDVAVKDFNSGTISILFGNGDGTFQPEVTYQVVASGALVVGDFNHDGKPDLAFPAPRDLVAVLLNKGGRAFQKPQYYSAGNGLSSVTVADMNNDGNPDLVVAEIYGGGPRQNGAVGVFLGNADGTFQSELD